MVITDRGVNDIGAPTGLGKPDNSLCGMIMGAPGIAIGIGCNPEPEGPSGKLGTMTGSEDPAATPCPPKRREESPNIFGACMFRCSSMNCVISRWLRYVHTADKCPGPLQFGQLS